MEIRKARGVGQSAKRKGTGQAEKMKHNDGCTGACTKRPGERTAYRAKMAKWIARIRSGEMKVAIWPRTAGDTTAWVEDEETAVEAARRVQQAIHI